MRTQSICEKKTKHRYHWSNAIQWMTALLLEIYKRLTMLGHASMWSIKLIPTDAQSRGTRLSSYSRRWYPTGTGLWCRPWYKTLLLFCQLDADQLQTWLTTLRNTKYVVSPNANTCCLNIYLVVQLTIQGPKTRWIMMLWVFNKLWNAYEIDHTTWCSEEDTTYVMEK